MLSKEPKRRPLRKQRSSKRQRPSLKPMPLSKRRLNSKLNKRLKILRGRKKPPNKQPSRT
jgi:hypothetical protein